MALTVVIPSHKRAGRVPALKAIAGAILCVSEGQAGAYRRAHPGAQLVVHPDTLIGLALKRQWIYEKYGDVFMVDDDVTCFRRTYGMAGGRQGRLPPEEAREWIEATAETARDMGAYLFGPAFIDDARCYKPMHPFRVTGVANGCALGLLAGSGLWFHPESVAVEDFWISALNAHMHRFAFFDTRFAPRQAKTFRNAGGQSDYRTQATEEADFHFLRRMFGRVVQANNRTEGWGRTRNRMTPSARRLVIPF